jgi:hypothetical protein
MGGRRGRLRVHMCNQALHKGPVQKMVALTDLRVDLGAYDSQKVIYQPVVVVHSCNPSTQESEAGGSRV